MSVADMLRILTIVLGSLMVLTTFAVVSSYAQLVRVTHRTGPRFLPWHVATIAAAFILLSTFGIAEMTTRFGEPLTWRPPLLITAFSLANIAQSLMFNVIRGQIDEGRNPL